MDPQEKLKEALGKVHSQRMAIDDIKAKLLNTQQAIGKTKNGKRLVELSILRVNINTALNNTISDAKQLAKDIAIELGNKKPHPGVLVKAKTAIEITDREAALIYVQEHYPTFLSFDETAFKRIMKALPDDALPEFITKTEDDYATPTIVKDLSEWFELTSEEPPF